MRRLQKLSKTWQSPSRLGPRIPMISLIHTLAVAEHLNFHHAAKALGTSQSSVSARIRALEEELGILLFERNTRGVRLTEAGRQFVERVAAGLDLVDNVVRTASLAASGDCGRMRVGVHGLIGGSFLDGLLTRYRAQYPAIAVEVAERSARPLARRSISRRHLRSARLPFPTNLD